MAFPTTSVLDTFTGSAGADANWTRINGGTTFSVINYSGAGAGTDPGSGTQYAFCYWNPTTSFGPDAEAYATLTTAGSETTAARIRVGVRTVSQGTTSYSGYLVSVTGNGTWTLGRVTAGAITTLATYGSTQVVAAGDSVGISVVGTVLTAYYKASGGSWTSLFTYDTASDATKYSAAGPVMLAFRTATIDSFGGGTVVAGSNFTKTLADTVTLSDAAGKTTALSKADNVTASDALTTTSVFSRALADTLTLSDVAAKTLVLALVDTSTLSDALSKTPGVGLADTMTLSDALAKATVSVRVDTLTLSDGFARTAAFARALTDTVTLSDTVAKTLNVPLSDTVTLSDALGKKVTLGKTDSISVTDAVAKALGLGRADSVTLTDAVAKSAAHTLADIVTLSDAATPTLGGGASTAWTLTLADTITLADALTRALTNEGASPTTAAHARVVFLSRFGLY